MWSPREYWQPTPVFLLGESSPSRDQTQVFCLPGRFSTTAHLGSPIHTSYNLILKQFKLLGTVLQTLLKVSNLRLGFPWDSVVKNLPANAGDLSSVPGSEDPLEKEMATHPSILAWKSHGQRNLTGYKLGAAKSQMWLNVHTFQSGTWSLIPVGTRKINRRHHGLLFSQSRRYRAGNGLRSFESQTEYLCHKA